MRNLHQKSPVFFSKAVITTQITQDEASEWFKYLEAHTEDFIKKNHGWYVKKGYWPIKARKKGAADKNPVFTVHHHTSNRDKNYKPAINRFFKANKASSNFLLTKEGDIIYLVSIHDMSYHATIRTWLPISVRRFLGIESKWINEPGIETPGNGNSKLFTPEQFLAVICLQRYLNAYFPSMKELKSHRFLSPKSRSGDPGPTYLLPLIEHAAFHDVDLRSDNYWLAQYSKDPVSFMKDANAWIEQYGLKDRDEWFDKRDSLNVSEDML